MADQIPAGGVLPRDLLVNIHGKARRFPAGTPIAVIKAEMDAPPFPDEVMMPEPEAPEAPMARADRYNKNMIKGGLTAAELALGMTPLGGLPGAAVRVLGPMLAGHGKDMIDPGGNKFAGLSADETTEEGVLGVLSELLGRGFPKVARTYALRSGGLGRDKKAYDRLQDAYSRRDAATPFGRPRVPVGAQGRAAAAEKAAQLEVTGLIDDATNSGIRIRGTELRGAGREALRRRGASRDPSGVREGVLREEDRFVKSTLGDKGGQPMRNAMAGTSMSPSGLIKGAPPMTKRQRSTAFNNLSFTPKETQAFAVEQGRQGNKLYEAMKAGAIPGVADEASAGVAKGSRDLALRALRKQIPGLEDAQRGISDWKIIQDANKQLRTGITQLAIRGAIGGTLAGGGASLAGADPMTAGAAGVGAGLGLSLLGGPRASTTLGNVMGSASFGAPSGHRLIELLRELGITEE